mmetsp:Transcript_28012/g.85921  ORF Transcript_28012/g.85921 Transcript_28012/m.85921 type:complete len:205 (-) Transcript_28012:1361-1975(-)
MYAATVLAPYSRSSASNKAAPFAFAATCARRSLSVSDMLRHAANWRSGLSGGGVLRAGDSSNSTMPFSSKTPFFTNRKASMTAPSSASVVESAGIEPGVDPPTSAWWPREAQKYAISSWWKTGVITVMSGRCEPPNCGSFATMTSPFLREAPPWNLASCALTVSDMAPRCTGTCGAFATRAPSWLKIAQLKSSRSLMFTEVAVL